MPVPSPESFSASSEFTISAMGRRRALGALGAGGAALIASSLNANAFLFGPRVDVKGDSRSNPTAVKLPDLPEEWLSRNPTAGQYMQYLSRVNFKKIDPGQVIAAHAKKRGSVWNELPRKDWWPRMVYTLRVVDRIAVEMNINKVEVTSAYRSPSYNARCAGARSGSWHKANVATDVQFGVSPRLVTRTARNLRDQGLFKGGIGGYWNFTHIDTRGTNVNW